MTDITGTASPAPVVKVAPEGFTLVTQNQFFRTVKVTDDKYPELELAAKTANIVLVSEFAPDTKDDKGAVVKGALINKKRPAFDLTIPVATIDTLLGHKRGEEFIKACIEDATFTLARTHVNNFLEVTDAMLDLDSVIAKMLDSLRAKAVKIDPKVKAAVIADFTSWATSHALPTAGINIIVKLLKQFFGKESSYVAMENSVQDSVKAVVEQWFSELPADSADLYTEMLTLVMDNIDKVKQEADISSSLFVTKPVEESK